MAHANLLFPEATVNDAAAQVVYPLPLNDVIKDELLAYGRLELTWRQNKRITFQHCDAGSQWAVKTVCYLEQATPFLEPPTGSLRR